MKTETNWEQYDNVALAVLIHSTESGWIEVARWNDTNRPAEQALREARAKYEAMDGKKMLLNFGSIIAECDDRFKHVRDAANRRDAADVQRRMDRDNDGWAQ